MTATTQHSEELLIRVDKQDQIIDYADRQRCHQGEGLLHRAFSIFLFNEEQQVLLQQRSKHKQLWPLYWSNSVCSHPRQDESYEQATQRRLQDELGIETPLTFLFRFSYQAMFQAIGAEHELCSVYIGRSNGTIHANPDEIANWKYVDIQQLDHDVLACPDEFTPWFKMEWEQIRTQYNEHLIFQ